MQQRGVSRETLGLLMKYGKRAPAGRGAEIVYFDNRVRRQLLRETDMLPNRQDSKQLNSYVVCKKQTVLTAGKRFKKVRKP